MKIVLVNPEKIINDLQGWELPFPVKLEDFPTHTFAALDDGILIAVAGLRLCEGPLCILDSLATHSIFKPELRAKAIDSLVDTILSKAKELGFKGIVARSKETSIILRAIARGFSIVPEFTFARSL